MLVKPTHAVWPDLSLTTADATHPLYFKREAQYYNAHNPLAVQSLCRKTGIDPEYFVQSGMITQDMLLLSTNLIG